MEKSAQDFGAIPRELSAGRDEAVFSTVFFSVPSITSPKNRRTLFSVPPCPSVNSV